MERSACVNSPLKKQLMESPDMTSWRVPEPQILVPRVCKQRARPLCKSGIPVATLVLVPGAEKSYTRLEKLLPPSPGSRPELHKGFRTTGVQSFQVIEITVGDSRSEVVRDHDHQRTLGQIHYDELHGACSH